MKIKRSELWGRGGPIHMFFRSVLSMMGGLCPLTSHCEPMITVMMMVMVVTVDIHNIWWSVCLCVCLSQKMIIFSNCPLSPPQKAPWDTKNHHLLKRASWETELCNGANAFFYFYFLGPRGPLALPLVNLLACPLVRPQWKSGSLVYRHICLLKSIRTKDAF